MTTLAELLDILRRLHLLEPAQLEALARQWAGQKADPRLVTKKLVEQGSLTHFQANQIFKGKGNDLLLGSYVLLELLGEGGMGAVYKARNWKLGQVVALKLIRKERLTNVNAAKRFQREIRASAQLHHPNIVRAWDADEVHGTHLLVMEYVAGGQDLHKLVREQGPLPIEEACRFLQQAAMGLQHAFERGLVHRDIKPHNLILQIADFRLQIDKRPAVHADKSAICKLQSAMVKILDFGLARLGEGDDESSTLTQEGSVMGTLDYLAPEQARDSHTADIRADLYSLGCTMYFLLTGQAPFPGGTVAEKMYKHQFAEPTPLQALQPETPNGVADIVGKLMAKAPEDRYQAPAELALDLEAFLAGRPVSASASAASKVRPVTGSDTSQSLQETFNPFAGLSRSETAADEPVASPIATAKLPAAKTPAGNHNRLMLMAGGGAAALVVLIVTLVVVFTRKPPSISNEPKIVHSTPRKPTAIDFAAQAEKLRQQEEAAEKKKKADEEAARQKWIAEEEVIRKKRTAEAEEPFKLLEAKYKEKDVSFVSFAKEVAAFKAKHGGTPQALRAAEMLMRLPSPLDKLDPAKIPAYELEVARRTAGGSPAMPDLVAILGESRLKHWSYVRSVAFSPDGKMLASASQDGTVKLWDSATGSELRTLNGQSGWVFSVAFSPDGKTLASGNNDHTVTLWDPVAGSQLRTLKGHTEGVLSVAFSPDGKMLASGSTDLTVKLWDPHAGSELRTLKGHTRGVWSAAFSPDGKMLASASDDQTVKLWDPAAGSELRTLKGHNHFVYSVAFSPDGKTLVSGGANSVKLWDPVQGVELRTLDGQISHCFSVAFSRDGKTLALGSDVGTVKLCDPAAGRELRTLKGHVHLVYSVAFSPDGKTLASGSSDNTIKLWDPAAGSELRNLKGHTSQVFSVAFNPDGKTVASGSSDNSVMLWDAATGSELLTLKGHTSWVRSVAFSPDGKTLASGSSDNTVTLWDPAAGSELRNLKGHTSVVNSVGFSPDGKTLALGSADQAVTIWDPAAGSELRTLTGHSGPIASVAFSPDGKTLTSSSLNTVMLWDPTTGSELRTLTAPYGAIMSVAFSPDGKTLAAGCENISVKLWDPIIGSELHTLTGHTRNVYSVAFSPDGKTLASAALDGTVRLWDPVSATAIHVFQIGLIGGQVHQVAFAADGRHLATANGNGTVYILRIPDDVLPPKALTGAEAKQRQADAAKALDVPVTIENSIVMKLNLIPAGRFLMGSPEDEPGRNSNEGPQHQVAITSRSTSAFMR